MKAVSAQKEKYQKKLEVITKTAKEQFAKSCPQEVKRIQEVQQIFKIKEVKQGDALKLF